MLFKFIRLPRYLEGFNDFSAHFYEAICWELARNLSSVFIFSGHSFLRFDLDHHIL